MQRLFMYGTRVLRGELPRARATAKRFIEPRGSRFALPGHCLDEQQTG